MSTTCTPNRHAKLRMKLSLALAFAIITTTTVAFPFYRGQSAGAQPPAYSPGDPRFLDPMVAPGAAAPAQLTADEAQTAYGKVGMSFEANQGQTNEAVKFLARGAGYTLFLTSAEAVFVLANSNCGLRNDDAASRLLESTDPHSEPNQQSASCNPHSRVLRMKLEGASSQPEVSGLNELDGKVNYFIGNDPDKWHTNVPTFGRVQYVNAYDGVDMVYYGNQQQLEYDFVVRPGADYKQIALGFDGADNVEVDSASGDLLLHVGERTVRQQKPAVYQEVNGERKEIESGYMLRGAGRIGFAVGAYDSQRPLIIDPVLAYSTYLGGNGDLDSGHGIAVDSAGNAYVTGLTDSTDFPTTLGAIYTTDNPGSNVFVSKVNALGTSLAYSAYLGGNSLDYGNSIAVDAAGNAYVTGITLSNDFPTTTGSFDITDNPDSDAFVARLNASGSALIYSTYLGGDSFDAGNGIAVDAAGNVYVTGLTGSTEFPTTPGAYDTTDNPSEDVFVTKLNASGSALIYSTCLGGNGRDIGYGIAIDSAENAYVTGDTTSTNFPTTSGAFDTTDKPYSDVFVTKLNASGTALMYSTYLGGNSNDAGYGIAVDSMGNAYVTGPTDSSDFPRTGGAFDVYDRPSTDVFVTKLNASGTALVYSTYLGGNLVDVGRGIAVDSAGNACVTGETDSTDFPTTCAFGTNNPEIRDVFVTKLNASGKVLVYSAELAGHGHNFGKGIAMDSAGNAYVTGETEASDFPTTTDAFQMGPGSRVDGFVAKIGDYAISGRVIDSSATGIAGVTVTLNGSRSDSTTTDAHGNFIFLNTTPGGNFTVTPFKTDFIFSPESTTVNDLTSNQELIFIGTTTAGTPTPTPTATPTPTPATFHFSAVSFSVNEGAGSIQIIVTRSGDTSSAAAIDYATIDGTANDRGDYTTAIGRLHFNAGETAKSFLVFITDDVFAEGNETINIAISNSSAGAQVGGYSTVVVTIVDNDLVNGPANPIDNTQFFVRQHYVDFFNREPDAGGFAFWVNNIESCGANASCREIRRIDTSAAFFLSIEFQETGFLVHRFYRAAFNRLSHYREFIRDSQEIGHGVIVGQAGFETQLEANKQAFASEFVTRAEFLAIYGGLTNEQYVDALNANTGGSLSISERDALVAGLNGATETRASVLRKVADNAAFKAREFNPAFVLMEYFGYLRRNPNDLPDRDFSGYNYWLAKLNSFGGDFRRADMVKAFLSSTEYRQRFGPP
jgi:hypothetical protein